MDIVLRNYAKALLLPLYSSKSPVKQSFFALIGDALPIKEAAPVPFASEMAICMHVDTICTTTMLLGAAKLLKHYQQDLVGTVKLVSTWRRGFTGAKAMLKAGVLENPHGDAGIAFHVVSGIPSGTISWFRYLHGGVYFISNSYKGTGCQGAMPEAGVDPINIAAQCLSVSPGNHCKRNCSHPTCRPYHWQVYCRRSAKYHPRRCDSRGKHSYMDYKISKYIFDRIEEISPFRQLLLSDGQACERNRSTPPLQNDSDMVKGLPATWRMLEPP